MSPITSFGRQALMSAAGLSLAVILSATPVLAKTKAAAPAATPATDVTTPAAAPATASNGGICYSKKDGKPSAFDLVDVSHTGSITMDQVTNFYKGEYAGLPAAQKTAVTQDKYVANHIGYFKGIDKDKNGSVSCQEYQASITKLTAHKTAAVKPAAGAPQAH